MADENKPTDKIDLASTELKVGGVNLKGAYIVWFFAAVSAVGGSIYAAGQVWGEYQGLVKRVDSIKMRPVARMGGPYYAALGEIFNRPALAKPPK